MTSKTINWKNFKWIVHGYKGGPGPNTYSTTCAAVKDDGLHLLIKKIDGKWNCAELKSSLKLGYGEYRCVFKGDINNLDPNIVLAMFSYGGIDYINEIDIEVSHWGFLKTPPLNYTSYPSIPGPKFTKLFPMVSAGAETTHKFIWTPQGVTFISQQGNKKRGDLSDIIATVHTTTSPAGVMPICFDFWLMEGKAPKNRILVEMVVTDFEFYPL